VNEQLDLFELPEARGINVTKTLALLAKPKEKSDGKA